eukprot:3925671-Rhodomonas_salina.3
MQVKGVKDDMSAIRANINQIKEYHAKIVTEVSQTKSKGSLPSPFFLQFFLGTVPKLFVTDHPRGWHRALSKARRFAPGHITHFNEGEESLPSSLSFIVGGMHPRCSKLECSFR